MHIRVGLCQPFKNFWNLSDLLLKIIHSGGHLLPPEEPSVHHQQMSSSLDSDLCDIATDLTFEDLHLLQTFTISLYSPSPILFNMRYQTQAGLGKRGLPFWWIDYILGDFTSERI